MHPLAFATFTKYFPDAFAVIVLVGFADAGYEVIATGVGKIPRNKNNIELSAFHIPYGKAFYMSKNVIHNDCFLIGKYNVIYTKTLLTLKHFIFFLRK